MATTRPFTLHLDDGRVWHGAQFPSGHVAVNHLEPGGAFTGATSMSALLDDLAPEDPLHGARIEWDEPE